MAPTVVEAKKGAAAAAKTKKPKTPKTPKTVKAPAPVGKDGKVKKTVRKMSKKASNKMTHRITYVAAKKMRNQIKNLKVDKVDKVKKEIKVIKRAGGTLRFARALKKIRVAKKEKVQKRLHRVLSLQQKRTRREIVQAAYKTKSKDGRAVRPQFKRQHQYKVCKMRQVYHTQLPMRSLPSKNTFKDQHPETHRHRSYLRKSLQPGTVCILLAGRHKCKKVVFLKQLRRSGLCLVTGPWSVNRVPLRRMDQRFLIATSVRITLHKKFSVPVHIDDSYFKKPTVVKKKVSKADDDIFKTKKVTLKKKPSIGRREDQKCVDNAILKGLKKHVDRAAIKKYLKRDFGLLGDRYAHKLNF